MTQNPYAQFGQAGGDFLEPVERRTSVLAIVALVMALLCFIPGFGAIALVLGGAALIFISRSSGRLGGMGLAVTAIVLGLLTSLLWITMVAGMMSFSTMANQHFMAPVGKVFTGIDKLDYPAARSMFSPRANKVITDAEIAAFSKTIKDEMGAYSGPPEGFVALFASYRDLAQAMQNVQGRNDIIPFPGKFEKGTALLALKVDQHGNVKIQPGQPNMESIPLMNVALFTRDGKEVWLVDPDDMRKRLGGKDGDAADDETADPKTPADDGTTKAPEAPEAPKAPEPPKTP